MANGKEKNPGNGSPEFGNKKANRADRADRVGKVVALFDFDGVIMDTEPQYTVFWNRQGKLHLGEEDFGPRIKGQTLTQIYHNYFMGAEEVQKQITAALNAFEEQMSYVYVPGAARFMKELRKRGVKTAIVTSSNEVKMQRVYKAHPELKGMVDCILTEEMFPRSKPAPDCFLLGMKQFGATPEQTYVFEDSFHGIQAGIASGATVIGLATTNPREAIAGKTHDVIDDFTEMTYERMTAVCRELSCGA
ncbi:HAD family hydrolase [Bacteroides pyogenes]|uniref:Putative phosphatase/phosphohexomutase n=2 Tax=Bacteroides pyogenes TaxID=310300 RepID=W4PGR7_9BACE|nr:HAD family phosphatase [Bacteroides pyogenes]GAE16151.1 putative phosphatase/phosphohexomutase [Bacteroides pyogenes JCM 6292]GAE18890.1 putative phosphatase/phosphohexomutase [Bacteroides pyogenes DSM 20611 = JCM 6294]